MLAAQVRAGSRLRATGPNGEFEAVVTGVAPGAGAESGATIIRARPSGVSLPPTGSAVTGAIGADRTGIRLSPWSNANNVGIDSDTPALFAAVAEALNAHDLAFVHVVEGQTGGPRDWPAGGIEAFRAALKAPYIANNGYTRDTAVSAVATGAAYAVAFGKAFIANPDLPARLKADAPLNPPRQALFYGGGAEGYTDYPTL